MVDKSDVEDSLLAHLFKQLLESTRFQQFFEINYDVKKVINEEEKSIEYLVVEVPPAVAVERMAEKHKLIEDTKNKVSQLDTGIVITSDMPKFKA